MKREVLQGITTVHLTKLNIADKKSLLELHWVEVGLSAEAALKVLWYLNVKDCGQAAGAVFLDMLT